MSDELNVLSTPSRQRVETVSSGSTLITTRQLASGLGQTLLDALPGMGLPLSEERVASPQFLNSLFSRYGVGAYQQLRGIEHVDILDIQSISSNCSNRVLSLHYDSTASPDWPARMFLKMPVPELGTRLFFSVIRSWQLECEFYQRVAQDLPIRTPQPYLVAMLRSRFVMLMEDLYADPSVSLHINADMMQGPDDAVIRSCLNTFARLHAGFHGISEQRQQQLLPAHLQPYTSPVMKAVSPIMGRVAMKACRKDPALTITDEHHRWYQRGLQHWDQLVDWWTRGPLTLVHGDSHLGNHFLDDRGGGMLDWQAVQWGRGIRDVQYFLTDTLPAQRLASQEVDWVRYYLDALGREGVQLDFDEVWHDYRGFSLQTWMTIVVSLGLNPMTDDMQTLMPEIHHRCIASIERLDLGGWLDDVLTC